ncbi:PREDICTED: uncharacterized protein LOC107162796 isoform X2 [Diuraphis noxia]|uniref:uncharacterized protein LOC107162796 isoform X2 n=1 Tax=Diuraphis noxia TaxID=143948 RepID=UPI0007638EA0|nr:PREDICTED: uncharacterized protein LOC107162796 isoform X2 [Diuraphis noxia]
MESESPLEVLSRAATMLHREETAAAAAAAVVESSFATNHSRALSLRCSAMEGTVGTVGKWKRERRHRAVCTSPVSPTPPPFRNSQEPLDMTTTAGSRALPKERASVIMASPATGHRVQSSAAATTTTGGISDPVIDEHFRRSLGKDYMNVFAPAVAQRQQQQVAATAPSTDGDDDNDDDQAGLSGTYLNNYNLGTYCFGVLISYTN